MYYRGTHNSTSGDKFNRNTLLMKIQLVQAYREQLGNIKWNPTNLPTEIFIQVSKPTHLYRVWYSNICNGKNEKQPEYYLLVDG